MATKKFKNNLISLLKVTKMEPHLLCEFLCEKNAFSEEFILLLTNSNTLNKFDENSDYCFTIEDIRQKLKDYDVTYNEKGKRVVVDITKNNIFSYYDTEEELVEKMRYYLKIEDYESASILNEYLKKIEIDY